MGARGPAPKRSSERRRRNKENQAEQVAPLIATVEIPPADESWHPIARRLYDSLAMSGQSRFYEPSDWAAAAYAAEITSRNLRQAKLRTSSQLAAAAWSMWSDLLVTEGMRRRARMEVERELAAKTENVTSIDDYRKAMGA